MGILVRPVTEAEYAVAGEICTAAYLRDGQLSDDSEYAAELADVAARVDDSEVMVAVDGETGSVLGTVTFARHGSRLAELAGPGEAEFRMLAVDPAAQRRGIGAALARACVDRAVELGCTAVVLYTRDYNAVAQQMYLKLGFERRPDQDWHATETIHLVAMRRDLTGPADRVTRSG